MTIDRDIRRLMARKILTDDPQEKARLTAEIRSAENARSLMKKLPGAGILDRNEDQQ